MLSTPQSNRTITPRSMPNTPRNTENPRSPRSESFHFFHAPPQEHIISTTSGLEPDSKTSASTLNRLLRLSNSELLSLIGLFTGIPIAIMTIVQTPDNGPLPTVGTSQGISHLYYQILGVSFIAGAFGASLAEFGHTIDSLTNKKTVFDFGRYLKKTSLSQMKTDLSPPQIGKILKDFLRQLEKKNNLELGRFFASILGIGTGIYAILFISAAAESDLSFVPGDSAFHFMHLKNYLPLKILAVPLISGLSGILIGFGFCEPIDILTKEKTLIDLAKHVARLIKNYKNSPPSETQNES